MAERAAWKYIEELPSAEKFELVTICPSLVVGKPLHSRAFTSGEVCEKMFTGEFPVMRVKFPFVRVEDVSRAHLQAIKVTEAAGHRFVLNEKCYWMREVAQSLANVYNPQGYSIGVKETPHWIVWCVSIFVKELNGVLGSWDLDWNVDHKKTEQILGIDFQDPMEGVNQTIEALIQAGKIPDKRKKK